MIAPRHLADLNRAAKALGWRLSLTTITFYRSAKDGPRWTRFAAKPPHLAADLELKVRDAQGRPTDGDRHGHIFSYHDRRWEWVGCGGGKASGTTQGWVSCFETTMGKALQMYGVYR